MRSLIMSIALLFVFIGCGGGDGDSTSEVETPTDIFADDVPYSDNSGSKSLGDLGNPPPLYISNEEPTANTQVSITAEGIAGNTINITAKGAGCGTIQDTSGTSPFTIEGTVGAYGDCNIKASYDVSGEERMLAGRFIVAATRLNKNLSYLPTLIIISS